MLPRYRLIVVLRVLTGLLAVAGSLTSPVRAEPPRFSAVAPGIAHAAFKVRPADTEPFSGHAFTIDLEPHRRYICNLPDPRLIRTYRPAMQARLDKARQDCSGEQPLVESGGR